MHRVCQIASQGNAEVIWRAETVDGRKVETCGIKREACVSYDRCLVLYKRQRARSGRVGQVRREERASLTYFELRNCGSLTQNSRPRDRFRAILSKVSYFAYRPGRYLTENKGRIPSRKETASAFRACGAGLRPDPVFAQVLARRAESARCASSPITYT